MLHKKFQEVHNMIKRKVTDVIDSQTLIVDKKIGTTNRIRLAGISTQNKQTTDKLRKLIVGKTVTIVPVEK